MQYILVLLTASILLPFAIGVKEYDRLGKPVRIFFLLIAVGVLTEGGMVSLALAGVRNLYFLHFYSLCELIILSWFYYTVVHFDFSKKYILAAALVVAAISVMYALRGNNIHDFNALPRALESLVVVSFGAWLYYEMSVSDGPDPLHSDLFYINAGVLFYFTSSFIVFAFAKYVGQGDHLRSMYIAHSIVNAFCNIIYLIGIWKSSRSYSTVR